MGSLNIKKILLLDGVHRICAEKLKQANIEVTEKGKLSQTELVQEIKDYDAVIVRSATRISAESLAAGTRLQLVGRAGTGTDNIDVDAATRKGVIVMNTPGGNTVSAAEHTCTLICSLARFVPQACESLKKEVWDRKRFMGTELYGKTLAIIGLGRIGREVASRMQSFNMTVIGYDPFVSAAVAAEWNIEALELEEIWPRADYITVHTPLLPHTRNLLGEEVLLTKCKPGVKVVNVARGGIIDEAVLLRALNNGRCGGAALDVFVEEPPTDFELCRHPKVICTPHLGASTAEAQMRVAEEMAEQIVGACAGEPLLGLVNAAALTVAGSSAAQPWVALAIALGQVGHLIIGHDPTAVTLECFGSDCTPFNKALGSAVVAGLLKSSCSSVNLVNASLLAQDNNIQLKLLSPGHQKSPLLPPGIVNYLIVSVANTVSSTQLIGSVTNGLPVLLAVDESVWPTAIPLSRCLALYQALKPNSTSPLTVIADQLGHGPLLSLFSTTGGAWHAATIADSVQGRDAPGIKYLGQISF
ncbi:D-isomer specific 2-hydroxyacid dehydrogenase catalytic domain [Trinorchestia longiramus]|nr:D-isomer specific 2-hydroxyacid dehydrogenase catalytic domain [Trinorchestia longiramus]